MTDQLSKGSPTLKLHLGRIFIKCGLRTCGGPPCGINQLQQTDLKILVFRYLKSISLEKALAFAKVFHIGEVEAAELEARLRACDRSILNF